MINRALVCAYEIQIANMLWKCNECDTRHTALSGATLYKMRGHCVREEKRYAKAAVAG